MSSDSTASMSTMERMALALGRLANESDLSKAMQYHFVRNISYRWMSPAMSRRTYVHNIDWLIAPPSDRGVLLACNHQSFFDSYVTLFSLYASGAKWPRKLYYPVRSDFFYDSPIGMLVNMAIGGGVMYPPIYRDKEKKELTADALERISTFLNTPNSLVGIHPEGKRNKGDPYKLLSGQPGIGKIILQSKPLVVPVFINGLSNDFLGSIATSLRPDAKRKTPITVVFGEPVDYDEFTHKKPRTALYKRCTDKVMAAISECGQQEREIREKINSGEIDESAPGWLWYR